MLTICIVIMGYKGITYAGEQIIKNNKEIVKIEEDKNLKYMFYSEMDEIIQVFPWNYYDEKEAKNLNEESYNWLLADDLLESMRIFTTRYIYQRCGWETSLYEDIYSKLKPKRKDFKKITVESKVEEYLFYEKTIEIKEDVSYLVKYVLMGSGDIVAFYCNQAEDGENQSEKLQEEEIRSSLDAKISQLKEMVDYLDFFRYGRLESGTEEFWILLKMFSKETEDVIGEEYNEGDTTDATPESEDVIGKEYNVDDTMDATPESEVYKQKLDDKLSKIEAKTTLLTDYQIIVLSDRILVIAEDRSVILYYSREECNLIGFSLT